MDSHTCLDCGGSFNEEGQSGPHIQPAAQCPQCDSYRTQPSGIPDENNDMLHGQMGLPTSTEPDSSGDPLLTGILAAARCRACGYPIDQLGECTGCGQALGQDPAPPKHTDDQMSGNPLQAGDTADGGWLNRSVRDESFAASVRISLFETPEFETTQIVAPPDLYRHGLESEANHRAHIQAPNGITDNLHAALGNLGAWVENPYENGQLRPYYNKYWKVIRPSFMKPGSLQIGVADPTMAEIINHVAQTDDLAPLYEYRGKTSHHHTAGPLMAMLPEGIAAGLAGGGADAAGAAADGAADAGTGAGGIGSVMNTVMKVNPLDDAFGAGNQNGGGGGGFGGGMGVPQTPHDFSFYASDEDDANPAVHDEIPKNDDGDSKEQDDGNQHEWQRDISVNNAGGSLHSPSFDPAGPGFQRFMMLAPLLLQYLNSGEDASQDPLVHALHESLESEVPGYRDHADPEMGKQLLMILSPKGEGSSEPEKQEPTHTDENSGGAHESKTASLQPGFLNGGDFLPELTTVPPALNGARQASLADLYEIAELRKGLPEDIQYEITRMMREGEDQSVLQYLRTMKRPGAPKQQLDAGNPQWDSLATAPVEPMNEPTIAKTADTQGPQTPEQIQAVQQWLIDHGSEIGLQGDELTHTVLSVPTNPLDFADVLAQVQQAEPPPAPPQDAGMSANPPMPAQENAPPGATMPVPGMEQQMMSAVQRYAADSVAGKCPECGSHTTALVDEDGTSHCHACQNDFKTEGKTPNKVDTVTAAGHDLDPGTDGEPIQGIPIADQEHQRDGREEQDSGHTWTDETGNPLAVGQEYEMHSGKYEIPDLVRVDAVRPDSISYTITGEFGLDHSTEVTKEEANIEGLSFTPTMGHEGLDDGLEANDDDNTGYEGVPERTDSSAPLGLVSKQVVASGVTAQDNPQLSWLVRGLPKAAGANYTPMEQRALVDEGGTARNSELLTLDGTHYVTDADADQFLFGL